MAIQKKKPKELDRDNYIPFHLVMAANQHSRGASKLYLRLFGVGVIGWRILSFISLSENVTARQICQSMNLDKGAASREIQKLKRLSHIKLHTDPNDKRKQLILLTQSGADLHDKILTVALAREKDLMRNFKDEEKETLLRLLKEIANNLSKIDDTKYNQLVLTN